MKDFEIRIIEDRQIVIKGIGKMFYQEGMPIGIIAKEAHKLGYEVSWLHVVDELLKHGWSPKTILSKLGEEIIDSDIPVDLEKLKVFVYSEYDAQLAMIFEYLYDNDFDKAKKWFHESSTVNHV